MSNNHNILSTIREDEIPFELPDNWTWFKWGDLVIDYQQGLIRSNRELSDSGVPYLKMNNLDNNGDYNTDSLEHAEITKEELKKFKLSKGDFLINVRNSKELVGKTCVIRQHEFDLVFNHMLVRIKHRPGISNLFINALLKTPVMRKFVDRCKQGTTTVIALYQRDLYDIPIPLPDLDTQNSIVSFIENISIKLEYNNLINLKLEALAKSFYDYWFIQFDFPNGKSKTYKSNGGKMIWNNELKKEIPEGWEVKGLGEFCDLIRGVTYDKDEVRDPLDKNSIPILRATNLNNGVIDLDDMVYVPKELVSDHQKLRKFDILITMSSGSKAHVGKNAFYYFDKNISFGAFCSKLSINQKIRFYINSYIKSESFKKYVSNVCLGTNINNLTNDHIIKCKLLIPSEKQLIEFENTVGCFYDKIGCNLRENIELSSLRNWLLPMLMNGQVKVG